MVRSTTKLCMPLAVLLLASVPVNVMAASLGATAGVTTSGQVNAGGVSAGTNTSAGLGSTLSTKSNFSDVMASLSAPDASASIDLSQIKRKKIKIVRVSKLRGYSSSAMNLSDANKQNMAALDSKVAADATLTAALRKSGYSSSDVAAISTDAKGRLIVFVAK